MRLKLGFYLILLIPVLLILGIGSSCLFSKSLWDGKHQLNLIINGSPVALFSFNPDKEDQPLVVLSLPDNLLLEVARGYGEYQLGSVYNLGQQEGKIGGQLLSESVGNSLGIYIDAYGANTSLAMTPLKLINWLIGHKKETNLSYYDLIRFWWRIRAVRQDKIYRFDLCRQLDCLEEKQMDGSRIIRINPQNADQFISQRLFNQTIHNEDLTISVLNGTDQSGLATRAARIINNAGGRVVQIQQADSLSRHCLIRARKEIIRSYTLKKFQQIFNCQTIGGNQENERADMVIILGQDDAAEKLSKM